MGEERRRPCVGRAEAQPVGGLSAGLADVQAREGESGLYGSRETAAAHWRQAAMHWRQAAMHWRQAAMHWRQARVGAVVRYDGVTGQAIFVFDNHKRQGVSRVRQSQTTRRVKSESRRAGGGCR